MYARNRRIRPVLHKFKVLNDTYNTNAWNIWKHKIKTKRKGLYTNFLNVKSKDEGKYQTSRNKTI